MPGRLRSSVRIASSNPWPTSPTRFASGTRTPVKLNSAVGEPRMPILCSIRSTANPGMSFSTMKHESRLWRGVSAASSVTAKTAIRSATLPWLMKRFEPSRTHSAPSPLPGRRALVRAAATSLPASASVRAKAMSFRPAARSGNQRSFCSSVPARSSGSDASSWTARIRPLVAQTRLICSTARQTVSSSPPRPP